MTMANMTNIESETTKTRFPKKVLQSRAYLMII